MNIASFKGMRSFASAISYYSELNFTVSIPLDESRYDLVVDKGGKLYKVQTKYTSKRDKLNQFVLDLRTGSHRKGYTIKEVDFVYALTETRESYESPIVKLQGKTTIRLKNFEDFRIVAL